MKFLVLVYRNLSFKCATDALERVVIQERKNTVKIKKKKGVM